MAEPKTFEDLIAENQGLVESLAKSIHRRLPPFLRYEDVLSYGQLGLTQAARTFQPREGSSFSTYAYYRIQGSIFDGISRMNWTTRSTYRRVKREQMAAEVLADQDATKKDASPEGKSDWLFDTTSKLAMVYLSTPLNDSQTFSDTVEDDDADDPMMQAETKELTDNLRTLVKTLPEVERELIERTYYKGDSLAEAAKAIGKSRSWASRTHSKILKKLASELGA